MGTLHIRTAISGLVLAAGSVFAGDHVHIGLIELEDPIVDRVKTVGLGGVPTELTMRDLLDALGKVARHDEMKGLVIRLKDVPLSMANIDELGIKIKELRAAGKKVHLFAEGFDTKEIMLGSYCDEVIAQSGGAVSLPGIYMEEMFLGDAFRWVGITPNFVQIGDYKGASEQMANGKPSPQWDQNINQLLDSIYGHVRGTVKSGRKLSDKQLDSAMETTWMAFSEDAMKAGLVDSVIDLPNLTDHLAKAYGSEITWENDLLPDHSAEMEKKFANPLALLGELGKKHEQKPKRDTIAVLHIDGAIIDGESTDGGFMGGDGEVGSRTIRRALGEIEDNDKIKGCIIRVNSPGGSAIASEIIWQGVKRVEAKKPVWVSVGDMAASGGYYILVAGQKVYVNPSSIVGSIGVVGGKMAMNDLYSKLHVNVVPRTRGPRAGMLANTITPWTTDETKLVRQKMTETYDLFTQRVTAGRKDIDLKKTAEGRLFLGQKAIDLKMADKLGGLEDAVKDLASELQLTGAYDVLDYPAPKGFAEMLEGMMGGFGVNSPRISGQTRSVAASEVGTLVRSFVGEQNYRSLTGSMNAMLQMRNEPVILVSPQVLIFK